ncbi:MAG: hypothetical protein IPK15_22360 [Verrucomicrobia bacterium]|nr:hypothetical protein [Verrucomicrobiota bacterium]
MRTKLNRFRNTLVSPIALAAVTSVHAGTLTNCDETSLRTAIIQGGVITFACDGVIGLTSSIVITNDVKLDAGGRDVTLSGGGTNRIFTISPGARLVATALKLADGYAESGGAMHNLGTVILQACELRNHQAVGTNASAYMNGGTGLGGAVVNEGLFKASSCIFSNNIAQGGQGGGGGVWFRMAATPTARFSAMERLDHCVFVGNTAAGGDSSQSLGIGNPGGSGGTARGGAIAVSSNRATIVGCRLIRNRTTGGIANGFKYANPAGSAFGGAVYSGSGLFIVDCDIEENSATGGESRVQSGSGGAAFGGGLACVAGTNSVTDCRLFGNLATGAQDWGPARGGGLYNATTTTVSRSSFLTNSAVGGRAGRTGSSTKAPDGIGGGIFNQRNLVLQQSTVAYNRAQGGNGIDGCGGCSPPATQLYLNGGDGNGGGIFNEGALRATNITIAANETVHVPPT